MAWAWAKRPLAPAGGRGCFATRLDTQPGQGGRGRAKERISGLMGRRAVGGCRLIPPTLSRLLRSARDATICPDPPAKPWSSPAPSGTASFAGASTASEVPLDAPLTAILGGRALCAAVDRKAAAAGFGSPIRWARPVRPFSLPWWPSRPLLRPGPAAALLRPMGGIWSRLGQAVPGGQRLKAGIWWPWRMAWRRLPQAVLAAEAAEQPPLGGQLHQAAPSWLELAASLRHASRIRRR